MENILQKSLKELDILGVNYGKTVGLIVKFVETFLIDFFK